MQWWNNFVEWLNSDDGWRILSTVVFPLLAIVVAGFIAAMIGRGSTRRLLTHHDREQRVSTVTTMIGAARRASKWNTLSTPEQELAEHLAHDADVSLRLLPLGGSAMTADWAAHEIAEMKKNSVSFSFQAEQSLMEFRTRLIDWQQRPGRAKKLFKADLDLWAYESAQEDKGLVEKQQEWAKQQIAAEPSADGSATAAQAEPTPTGSAPISWDDQQKPMTATAAAPPAAAPTYDTPRTAPAAQQPPAQQPPAQQPGERPRYAMPSVPPQAPPPQAPPSPTTVDSGDQRPATPNPVSAQTVRQRTAPDSDDDLR